MAKSCCLATLRRILPYIYLTRSQIAFFQRVENAGLAKNQVQICELSWWHPGTLKLRL
jgi:hypothetical protein